jgi:signal transduction histidine kinase
MSDNRVTIHISDTGCGIPEENLSKIFDPMFTTKPFGEGTGLGLSIVHDILSVDFNGTISVESSVGVGTEFTLLINQKPLETMSRS